MRYVGISDSLICRLPALLLALLLTCTQVAVTRAQASPDSSASFSSSITLEEAEVDAAGLMPSCEASPTLSGSEDSSTTTSASSSESTPSTEESGVYNRQPLPPRSGAIPDRFQPNTPSYEKIYDAAQTYRRSGYARVVPLDDGEEVYPFGLEVPTVKTPVLHFSTVELAKNEYVTNINIGDKSRWNVTTGSMGQKGDFRQMVYIKPQECGPMQTNLLLATNKGRTYELILESIPCNMKAGERPDMDAWDRRISYYYPDGRSVGPANMGKSMNAPPQAQGMSPRLPPRGMRGAPGTRPRSTASDSMRPSSYGGSSMRPTSRQSRPSSGGPAPSMSSSPAPNPGQSGRTSRFKSDRGGSSEIDLRNVESSQYEVDVDRSFPCEPDFVGDDGERTYIRLGDSPGCSSTFPFYKIREDRSLQIANYSVYNGQTYVIEGVHEKSALLYRDDNGREHRVTITNTQMENDRPRRR